MSKNPPEPPKHLSTESKKFWKKVVAEFDLEHHHLSLLRLAAEAWDTGQMARSALVEAKSLTYKDRHGCPKPRPEVAIERDARTGFARMLRELNLDIEPPSDSRMPRGSRYA